jgi:hypothetical protein
MEQQSLEPFLWRFDTLLYKPSNIDEIVGMGLGHLQSLFEVRLEKEAYFSVILWRLIFLPRESQRCPGRNSSRYGCLNTYRVARCETMSGEVEVVG